ncbi:MAG: hypothetical protein K8M05_06305, partial [Deltaproteobacteria bacterium]|nr:hypothetical protein [Kofleriaceae bacterium]
AAAKPGGAPDAPDANAPKRPEGMSPKEWQARQENAKRTWSQKVGNVRKEYQAHRERYRERVRAEQESIAKAEDEAYAKRKQEIEDERVSSRKEADRAYDEAVAAGKKDAAAAAEARAKVDEVQVQKDYEAAREQSLKRNADEARRTEERYRDAKQDAIENHASDVKRAGDGRADAKARYEKAMAEAQQIEDPADRARAERWAKDSYEQSDSWAKMLERQAAERKASSLQRAEDDYARGKSDDAKSVTRREELDLESKASAAQRAQARRDRDRAQAEYQARSKAERSKHGAYDDAFQKRNERMDGEPDRAARDAGREVEGEPDRMRDGLNLPKTIREQRKMIKEYSETKQVDDWEDQIGGQKSLDWGDVSMKEFDPGFSPGGAMAREAVEERTKQAFGLDKKADGQFLGDHAKNENGERKNPNYTPPPAGSLKDLDTIKENWQKALEKQQEAEAATRAMQEEKAKHQANEAPIDGLHGEAKKALETTATHKSDVKAKADANVKQTQKQTEAAQKIDDYASQQAKFDAVITPMRGLERFTHIGAAVGVSYFDDMNKEIKKTLGGLEGASAAMKKEQAQQPQAKAELKAKAEAIAQTDAKAAATDASFKTSEKGVTQLKQDNTDAVAKAGAAEAEAAGQKSQYAAKVAQYQQQYTAMAGGLLSWARQHQSERSGEPAAVEVQDGGPEQADDAADGGGGGGG